MKRSAFASVFVLLLTVLSGPVLAQVAKSTSPIWGQAVDALMQPIERPLIAAHGATLRRTDGGLSFSLRMPTPEPGSYVPALPNAFQAEMFDGPPEAFSLWVFVINDPSQCLTSPCSMEDFLSGRGVGGVFNAAGHVVGGPQLVLSGHLSAESTPFGGFPLMAPREAAVLLAIAPHGLLQPGIMPDQITKPVGPPNRWWVAFFVDP